MLQNSKARLTYADAVSSLTVSWNKKATLFDSETKNLFRSLKRPFLS